MLEELTKDIPVPVHFRKKDFFKFDRIGQFSFSSDRKQTPNIFINKTENIEKQFFALIHENMHYLCYKKKCRCILSTYPHRLSEYHAEIGTLKYLIDNKIKILFSYCKERINRRAKDKKDIFNSVFKKVKKLKIYKKLSK